MILNRPIRGWPHAFRVLAFIILTAPFIASCGGGGGSGGAGNALASAGNNAGGGNVAGSSGGSNAGVGGTTDGGGGDWQPGVFLPASTYQGRCESPVPGAADVQGTFVDENNFLRSYSHNIYLWYDEIVDRDPALHTTPVYFDLLQTDELTPSGNFKDKFHFSIPTAEWIAMSQAGISVGYGANFALIRTTPPRQAIVVYTDPGTPAAAAAVERGAEILSIDGVDLINGSDVDTLNAGLFPQTAGETHTFEIRDRDGGTRTVTLEADVVTSTPVQNVSTIMSGSDKVGYLLFNDHIATAEGGLYDAVSMLDASGVSELVIDMRYNGGGFLDIASEFAYMIAGAGRTSGQVFEEIRFNDKHLSTNPVTGEPLQPTPFHVRSRGIDPSLPQGTLLPTLDLTRVYVLTGADTCSASESIINSLRGIDFEVIQIGSTTCGKPYGFYPINNCGTTYFTIQFQGVNEKGFGDYADGFSPASPTAVTGTPVPGCSVADDFTAALGDPAEARLAAALDHIDTGGCPPDTTGPSEFGLSKNHFFPSNDMLVPKSLWRQSRIMSE